MKKYIVYANPEKVNLDEEKAYGLSEKVVKASDPTEAYAKFVLACDGDKCPYKDDFDVLDSYFNILESMKRSDTPYEYIGQGKILYGDYIIEEIID